MNKDKDLLETRKRDFREFEEVQLQNEARKVLLVRVPPSVRRVWDSVKEADRLLGKIRIYKTSGDGKKGNDENVNRNGQK